MRILIHTYTHALSMKQGITACVVHRLGVTVLRVGVCAGVVVSAGVVGVFVLVAAVVEHSHLLVLLLASLTCPALAE